MEAIRILPAAFAIPCSAITMICKCHTCIANLTMTYGNCSKSRTKLKDRAVASKFGDSACLSCLAWSNAACDVSKVPSVPHKQLIHVIELPANDDSNSFCAQK